VLVTIVVSVGSGSIDVAGGKGVMGVVVQALTINIHARIRIRLQKSVFMTFSFHSQYFAVLD
jgi:hypothetical protein